MSPSIQLITGILAAIAAIASAVAAWKAQSIAQRSFDLQQKITMHQADIFLMRSTISALWQLKRILGQPLAVSDEDFGSFDKIHCQIRMNLESLAQMRAIEDPRSTFFSDLSRAEIVDQLPQANQAIDTEIKRLESKINEIFS